MPGGQSADRTCLHSNSFHELLTPYWGGEVVIGRNSTEVGAQGRCVCVCVHVFLCVYTSTGKMRTGVMERGKGGKKSTQKKSEGDG